MEAAAVGFIIAIAIGLTGVGAGIITVPVLVVIFGVPASAAVGTVLMFGAVTKMLILPVYAFRRQIRFQTAGYMLAGRLPGVLLGAAFLTRFDEIRNQGLVSTLIGGTIVLLALFSLYRALQPPLTNRLSGAGFWRPSRFQSGLRWGSPLPAPDLWRR